MTKNKLGLIVGSLFAVIHIIWSLAIAVSQSGMQSFIDWIFNLHRINLPIEILPFDFGSAVLLAIVTFVCGYIIGWILGLIVNTIKKD